MEFSDETKFKLRLIDIALGKIEVYMPEEFRQEDIDNYQAEESEKFWAKQDIICRREKEIGLQCDHCRFKTFKVDLEIPF